MIEEAEKDILAFYESPKSTGRSCTPPTHPSAFNCEIARRTDVVDISPDDASLIRLVSMLAIETNDEWLIGHSYISQPSIATLNEPATERSLTPTNNQPEKTPELIAA